MENAEFNNVYAIPANYTDSGKLLGGMLETRNAVETVALVILVGYPELFLFSMPAMMRIVLMVLTLIPLAVVSMMGIDGDSLFQYLGHIIRFFIKVSNHLILIRYKCRIKHIPLLINLSANDIISHFIFYR